MSPGRSVAVPYAAMLRGLLTRLPPPLGKSPISNCKYTSSCNNLWRGPFMMSISMSVADRDAHAVGGPCCPSDDPKAPHCPADNLYCQVRGWMAASINDTYCLEKGACGHLGQPVCNHTYATAPDCPQRIPNTPPHLWPVMSISLKAYVSHFCTACAL